MQAASVWPLPPPLPRSGRERGQCGIQARCVLGAWGAARAQAWAPPRVYGLTIVSHLRRGRCFRQHAENQDLHAAGCGGHARQRCHPALCKRKEGARWAGGAGRAANAHGVLLCVVVSRRKGGPAVCGSRSATVDVLVHFSVCGCAFCVRRPQWRDPVRVPSLSCVTSVRCVVTRAPCPPRLRDLFASCMHS